ncbi:CehA/McbA family metallohydrolase [Candidatus Villigracilis saccharophilus]|uniref:CehA/McbA family metallohydrolase n=1 Tax=Candidatus Villigracilis saccharophilus TaxID=3140684 RepID=UPI00313691E3|nr:PHP domain-containing protein [Anaerolineales bacterium]
MHEVVVNLHMHTRYSDGTGTHRDIAKAALAAGVDAVIVTDHNVLVQGFEGYYKEKNKKIMLLVGEEVHDQARDPQKNHLLVLGAGRELAAFAESPQLLINQVRDAGGLSFLAHPDDPETPAFKELDISWDDWSVQNYTGIELWNALSELKTVVPTKLHGAFYAFFPSFVAHQPIPATIERWDELLSQGRPVVAIGGSDAHALLMSMGPISRVIFPYEFHFRTVNTHVILDDPLSGEIHADKKAIYAALAEGHCFVGYDLPASTRGFRFTAQGLERTAFMGDELPAKGGVTLQAKLPADAEIRLLKDGEVVQTWKKSASMTHITTDAGVYRIEAYLKYLGKLRGWIYSNPIYVR